jgi:hypothetical protein
VFAAEDVRDAKRVVRPSLGAGQPLRPRPEVVVQAGEVAVVVVIAEGEVVRRHVSRVDQSIVKHKRLLLQNHEEMLYRPGHANG